MEVLGFYRIISPVHPIRLVTNNLHGGRRIHPARLRFVLAACRKSWIRRLVILALRQAALKAVPMRCFGLSLYRNTRLVSRRRSFHNSPNT
jgi:hypothetical protein